MADYNIVGGSTDQTIYVYITDLSSANEIGKTGLTFESAGLVASYVRTGAARTAITLATQTANGAHSDGGFVLVDDTNMPGVYRLDLPDAAVTAGVTECVVQLAAEADSVCRPVRIQISPVPANVTQFGGSAGTFASGVPAVNATQISGDSTAADNLETAFDDTAGSVPWLGIIDQGTAQSATATTLVLRAASAFANDELIGSFVTITGGTTGVGQTRIITDNVLSTDTITVDTWTTTPSGTITYKIWNAPGASNAFIQGVNVVQISGDATAADNCEKFFDGTGYDATASEITTVDQSNRTNND